MVGIGLENWMGLGMTTFAIIGLGILLILGFNIGKLNLIKTVKYNQYCKVIGGLMVGAVILSAMGVTLAAPEEAAVAGESAAWETSVTESHAWLTYNDDTKHFNWHMAFNDTADAFTGSTGSSVINFTLTNNAPSETFIAQAVMGNIGLVAVSGSSDEYIVDQVADDSFHLYWEKAGGLATYENGALRVEAGDSGYITCTIDLNADAVAEMGTSDSCDFSFSVAGVLYTVTAWKGTVTT